MATPEDPSAKEPLEEGGEKLKTEEAGKSTEKKREEEGRGEGVVPQARGWWRRSSSSDDDEDDAWDLSTWWRRDPFAPRFDFAQENVARKESLFFDHTLRGPLRCLSPDELQSFLRKLREIPLKEGFVRIPEEALHEAGAFRLADLLLSYYGRTYGAELAADALRAVGREYEADTLLGFLRSGYRLQSRERKRKLWSLEGVAITGDEIVCKGRKELIEIIEKDLKFFLRVLYYDFIITWKEYRDLQKAEEDSKEKSGRLLNMIQERGEATSCWFLEQVERKHPGSIQILLVAVHAILIPVWDLSSPALRTRNIGHKLSKLGDNIQPKSKSPLFAEEGRSSKMKNPALCEESVVCNLCPCEDLPETFRPEVFLDSETSREKYRLCFTKAGSFLCLYTDVIFEVRGAVTITYHFDSWSKHLAKQNTQNWVVAGPLINIEADPAEAVAAVHFPHFLCLAGEDGSQAYIAHFVEGGMSLEKPDRVGPYRVVLEKPNFSPRGAIFKTLRSWIKPNIHTVALLYQMVQFQPPTFHLYLLPNDASVRKAVHDHEVQCPSQRIEKPPGTLKPLTIGSRFFVETNDVRVCPKEVEFQCLDADKLQQYVELSAEQMQDIFNFSVMEKCRNELIWEAHVTQKDLKSPEMTSLLQAAQETQPPAPPEQHFVERHRVALIQRTATVEGILDVLHGDVVDDEQYQKISAKSTNQEKMRELYRLLPSWNQACKDKLYKALKMRNRFLVEDLEG
ncbi:caspase recruitment domain-containing protein 8-like [Zootoca vivipara]|uniref:caspase recruitment domain-containing protein 8-like n=1 Tax=Zootoca vivipara TaxID=8524 RepID=UPI00293C0EA1|nr:caspase recruitment domain-containing protein 8-like [Zootoca vivipara]